MSTRRSVRSNAVQQKEEEISGTKKNLKRGMEKPVTANKDNKSPSGLSEPEDVSGRRPTRKRIPNRKYFDMETDFVSPSKRKKIEAQKTNVKTPTKPRAKGRQSTPGIASTTKASSSTVSTKEKRIEKSSTRKTQQHEITTVKDDRGNPERKNEYSSIEIKEISVRVVDDIGEKDMETGKGESESTIINNSNKTDSDTNENEIPQTDSKHSPSISEIKQTRTFQSDSTELVHENEPAKLEQEISHDSHSHSTMEDNDTHSAEGEESETGETIDKSKDHGESNADTHKEDKSGNQHAVGDSEICEGENSNQVAYSFEAVGEVPVIGKEPSAVCTIPDTGTIETTNNEDNSQTLIDVSLSRESNEINSDSTTSIEKSQIKANPNQEGDEIIANATTEETAIDNAGKIDSLADSSEEKEQDELSLSDSSVDEQNTAETEADSVQVQKVVVSEPNAGLDKQNTSTDPIVYKLTSDGTYKQKKITQKAINPMLDPAALFAEMQLCANQADYQPSLGGIDMPTFAVLSTNKAQLTAEDNYLAEALAQLPNPEVVDLQGQVVLANEDGTPKQDGDKSTFVHIYVSDQHNYSNNPQQGAFEVYKCDRCEYTTEKKTNWYKHRRSHLGLRPYTCPDCSYCASTSSNMRRHMLVHTETKTFQCDLCADTFRQKIHLERHKRYKHEEKTVQCTLCNYVCANANPDLKAHMKRKHMPREAQEVFACTCEQCGFMAPSRRDLKQHMKFHRKGPELKLYCEHCSFVTDCESRLRRHVLIHTKERPFACGLCDYTATQKEHVVRHMKARHQLEVASSKRRSSAAASEANKETAATNRDGSEVYIENSGVDDLPMAAACGLIQKKKYEPVDYSGKEKLFTCNHCTMKFVKLINLYKHLRIQHRDAAASGEDGVFYCVACDFRTHNKKNLLVHMRKHMSRDPDLKSTPLPQHVYSCMLCNYTNPKRRNLYLHLKKKHRISILVKRDSSGSASCIVEDNTAITLIASEDGEDGSVSLQQQVPSEGVLDQHIQQITFVSDDSDTTPRTVNIQDIANSLSPRVVTSSQVVSQESETARLVQLAYSTLQGTETTNVAQEAADAIQGLQALAQQVTEVLPAQQQVEELLPTSATTDEEEGDGESNIHLSAEQLMHLSSGDYIEINGEMYKVEFTSEDGQGGSEQHVSGPQAVTGQAVPHSPRSLLRPQAVQHQTQETPSTPQHQQHASLDTVRPEIQVVTQEEEDESQAAEVNSQSQQEVQITPLHLKKEAAAVYHQQESQEPTVVDGQHIVQIQYEPPEGSQETQGLDSNQEAQVVHIPEQQSSQLDSEQQGTSVTQCDTPQQGLVVPEQQGTSVTQCDTSVTQCDTSQQGLVVPEQQGTSVTQCDAPQQGLVVPEQQGTSVTQCDAPQQGLVVPEQQGTSVTQCDAPQQGLVVPEQQGTSVTQCDAPQQCLVVPEQQDTSVTQCDAPQQGLVEPTPDLEAQDSQLVIIQADSPLPPNQDGGSQAQQIF